MSVFIVVDCCELLFVVVVDVSESLYVDVVVDDLLLLLLFLSICR